MKQLLNFVVVGGGPTGVEFCGELSDFIRQDLKRSSEVDYFAIFRLLHSNKIAFKIVLLKIGYGLTQPWQRNDKNHAKSIMKQLQSHFVFLQMFPSDACFFVMFSSDVFGAFNEAVL